MAPRIGVLAIQGDVREHLAALRDCGAVATPVKSADELNHIAGLVIPGGESTTMSILAVRNGLFHPLRTLMRAGLPMFGTCAGMIMLADRVADGRADQQTIGGLAITAQRNAFGRQVDSFETDLDIATIGAPPLRAVFIRAPLVVSVDPGVEVLARIPADGRIVAVQHGALLATSFHPELTPDRRIHQYFVDIVHAAA